MSDEIRDLRCPYCASFIDVRFGERRKDAYAGDPDPIVGLQCISEYCRAEWDLQGDLTSRPSPTETAL